MDDARALQALVVILGDEDMRGRFMALTRYDAATLRARVGEADVADAVAGFLSGHEPDLMRVARALGVAPDAVLGAVTGARR